MECFQLEFFLTPEECEIKSLKEKIEAVKTSSDKVRRALFAKNGELTKKVNDLECRMQVIERNICRPETIELNFTI